MSDPLNSAINLRGNPIIYIPSEKVESNPNILGFIDESPYRGQAHDCKLRLEQKEFQTCFIDCKGILMSRSHRNKSYPSAALEIHQRFAFFTKAIANLSNQALLAAVSNANH